MVQKNLLVNIPYGLVEPNLKRIVSLGIGVEIYLENNLIDELKDEEIKGLAKKLKENEIICTCHAPYMDLSPGGIDKKIRSITIERLKRAIEIANILEARTLVFHPGYDRWHFDGNVELWFRNSINTWTEILKEKEERLLFLVENVFEETPETLVELIKYFKGKIFFCFDTGHFNLFSKVSVHTWMESLKDYIREFHLHDNYGTNDDHLPLGDGNFPLVELKYVVRSLTYNEIYFVAEPHEESRALESIKRLKEFLNL